MKILNMKRKCENNLKVAKNLGKRGLTSGIRSSVSQRLDPDRYQITPQAFTFEKQRKRWL